MILQIYIARRFLQALALVIAVFIAILLPLDLAEQLGKIGVPDAGLGAAFELALLNLPGQLYSMLPLYVLLATLFLFLALARSSELVVIRGAGRSALRMAMAPAVTAFLLGLVAIAVLNPIIAATSLQYELSASRYQSGEERIVSVSSEGLWLRQGSEDRQTVIRAERANADGTRLAGTSFFVFDGSGQLQRRLDAETATLEDGAWALTGVKLWPLEAETNPEANSETFDTYSISSTLTAQQIRDSFGKPESVAIYELPGFIANLNAAGFAALRYRVWMQMEFSNPVLLAAMVLIAAGFTMGHTRFGRTGMMVFGAIILGFGLFFLRNFAQVLGEQGQIPVAIVAWTPPIAAIMLAIGFLLHREDG